MFHFQKEKGFTMIELMVSIGIIGMITAVVLFNQSDLSDRIALSNAASEIELQLREAQSYGISVREFRPGTDQFSTAYGADFNIWTSTGDHTTFYTFADLNKSGALTGGWGTCNPGPSAECIAPVVLSRGNLISRICVIQSSGSDVCTTGSSGVFGRVAITFLRPSPEARISFVKPSGTTANGSYPNFKGAKIEITSPKGATKTVVVYTNGQISIE